jgi:hypothetical protein
MFLAFGSAGLWFGSEYEVGTASSMGPGYFPLLLSSGLLLVGAFLIVRGMTTKGSPIEPAFLRPFALVIGAVVAFALLIERAGLAITAVIVVVMCALANRDAVRWWEIAALSVGLSAASVLLFVQFLNLQMPVWWEF